MKRKLCCIFNYAPLYRKSIFNKIDQEFDAQFVFGDMKSDIAKMDYCDFNRYPITIKERTLFKKLIWRTGLLSLAFRKYDCYFIIGDTCITYLLFIPLCHLFGKKVYAWGHGCKSLDGKLGWFYKWFYRQCSCFFTYGENGRQRLIDLGIPSNKLSVIYNSLNDGVEAESQFVFKNNLIKNHFKNDLPVLLFVGRLTKVKQLDWILNALDTHNSKGLFYNVLLIGDGEDKDRLNDIVFAKGLEDRVWFYGACYDDDELSSLLYNADLCVSPGNVGLTALHSMSYGTPVLSHNDFETQMPEYETIIPGQTGDLYDKGNFDDFCGKIEAWLTSNHDRSKVQERCYQMINSKWNSRNQINIIKTIIR